MSHGNNPFCNPFQQYDNYSFYTSNVPNIKWETGPQFGPSTWTPGAQAFQFYPPTVTHSPGTPGQPDAGQWKQDFSTYYSNSIPAEVAPQQQSSTRKCSVVWPIPKNEESLPTRPAYRNNMSPKPLRMPNPTRYHADPYLITQNPKKPGVIADKIDPLKAGMFPDIKSCYIQGDRISHLIKRVGKLINEDTRKSRLSKNSMKLNSRW